MKMKNRGKGMYMNRCVDTFNPRWMETGKSTEDGGGTAGQKKGRIKVYQRKETVGER